MTGLSGEKLVCSNIEGVVGTFVIRMTGEQPVSVLAGMDIHGEQRDRSGSCPSPSIVAADRSVEVSFAGSGTTLARLRYPIRGHRAIFRKRLLLTKPLNVRSSATRFGRREQATTAQGPMGGATLRLSVLIATST
jgi:hypothetical protein